MEISQYVWIQPWQRTQKLRSYSDAHIHDYDEAS